MALKDLTAPMVASENRLAWNPAPPSPSDGKQLVDSATLDGINKGINDAEYQKMAQEYAANEAALQQIQNQRLQSGLLGPTPQEQAMYQSELTNRYLTNLVGAKQAYQNAQVSQDEAGMANASLAGQQLREQGRAAGIDPALLSTDLTLDQARELQGQLEWQSVFNGMSADDYYQVQYNRYRDQGMGYTAAKRAAGADAAQYQAQQAARSSDAIFKYGLDGNGALNARGMQALMHMVQTGGDSGREMANIIANMLPGMKDAYSLNAQRALMGDRQGYQQDNMRLGAGLDMKKADHKHALDEDTANNNLLRTIKQMEAQMNIGAMGIQAQAQARAGIAAALGLSGDTATRYITTGHIDAPKSAGGAGSQKADKGLIDSLMKRADGLRARALEAEASGNNELAAQLNAQAEMYEQQADRAMGMGGSDNGGNGGVDVNNYDSLSAAFQKLINDNASRPWDKQRTRAELIDIFLANVGYDNPMAQDIVKNIEWGDPAESARTKPAEQEQAPQTSNNTSSAKKSASSTTYTGQQIVVPEGVAQAVKDAVTMIPVYGPDGKFKRSIYPYQVTPDMAINDGPNGKYVVE